MPQCQVEKQNLPSKYIVLFDKVIFVYCNNLKYVFHHYFQNLKCNVLIVQDGEEQNIKKRKGGGIKRLDHL